MLSEARCHGLTSVVAVVKDVEHRDASVGQAADRGESLTTGHAGERVTSEGRKGQRRR